MGGGVLGFIFNYMSDQFVLMQTVIFIFFISLKTAIWVLKGNHNLYLKTSFVLALF